MQIDRFFKSATKRQVRQYLVILLYFPVMMSPSFNCTYKAEDMSLRGGVDKSLARPGRKQATAK